jgi:hypothetical protein
MATCSMRMRSSSKGSRPRRCRIRSASRLADTKHFSSSSRALRRARAIDPSFESASDKFVMIFPLIGFCGRVAVGDFEAVRSNCPIRVISAGLALLSARIKFPNYR